jgi:hypothetical protein
MLISLLIMHKYCSAWCFSEFTAVSIFCFFCWCWRCGLQNREYGRRDPSRWSHGTLYPLKLAVTSPTSGGRSVGIVPSRTQATEFFYVGGAIRKHNFFCYACGDRGQLHDYYEMLTLSSVRVELASRDSSAGIATVLWVGLPGYLGFGSKPSPTQLPIRWIYRSL